MCFFSLIFLYRARRNRLFLDQEAQLNAPDPRESNPPCYDDAILMPRLDWTHSLDDLTVKRNKRKNNEKIDDNDEEPYSQMSRRNRSRSENVIHLKNIALLFYENKSFSL